METESRTKTFFMVLGLAAFVGIGAACFSMFGGGSSGPSDRPASESSCSDLEDQAKVDCEQRQGR